MTTDLTDDDAGYSSHDDVSARETGGRSLTRRRALGAIAATGTTALAGCQGLFETQSAREPPVVENRPKAVYVPSHVEGMSMAGMKSAGDYRMALSVTTPHRFWLITGPDRQEVTVEADDAVHLMCSPFDPETGIVPPSGNVEIEITRDGETVDERSLWPMLSQRMGFHFGDNVGLDGDGTYEVTATVGPMDARGTGAFHERFQGTAEASFELEFSQSKLEELPFRPLDDRKGDLGAVSPMDMDMLSVHQLPEASAMPGEVLGETQSADAKFVLTRLPEPPEGVEGSGPYLAVSARTPYNRYPLPFLGLSATVESGGETVFDDFLQASLDPELDFHYGAAVDSLSSGDAVTLSFGAPPGVARHEGYETAFLEFEDRTTELE